MNLLQSLQYLFTFLFVNGSFTVALLVGGTILILVWRKSQKEAEKGPVIFWAKLFFLVFLVINVGMTLIFVAVVLQGSGMMTQFVFTQLGSGRDQAQSLVVPPLTPVGQSVPGQVPGQPTAVAPGTALPTVAPLPTTAPLWAPTVSFAQTAVTTTVPVTLMDPRTGAVLGSASDGLLACGWYVQVAPPATYLVGCANGGPSPVVYDASTVAWQGVVPPPPAAPTPTAVPTAALDPVAVCGAKVVAWANGDTSATVGTDLAPEGYGAEVVRIGVPAFLPGDTEFEVTITSLPGQPSFKVGQAQVSGQFPETVGTSPVQFVGTGSQCAP